ncbi:MAG: hypothetical protein ACPLXM_07140 [Bacteroidales bacterium]
MVSRQPISDLSDNFLLHGSRNALPEQHNLCAGPINVIYENGNLRSFKLGEIEILRMIYPAVRDPDWNTVLPEIQSEFIQNEADGFQITYHAVYDGFGIKFEADFLFLGRKDGSVLCSMKGIALEDFMKNRIGFCILHPIHTCAGKNVIVGHSDGSIDESFFPDVISPHQPFQDIAFLEYETHGNIKARLDFEGDVFESEDQRNWTDSSYKIYSTPLSLPFPVLIKKNTVIQQHVRFSLLDYPKRSEIKLAKKNRIEVFILEQESKMPFIGMLHSSRFNDLGEYELSLLKELHLNHIRADLLLSSNDWENKLTESNLVAKKMGVPLFLSLEFDDNFEQVTKRFVDTCYTMFPRIVDILLVNKNSKVTNNNLFASVESILREALKNIQLGAGTNAYFAEFNRNKPFHSHADFLVWSMNPQVHAFDHQTLVENLQAQADTIITARTFFPDVPLYVSPVTLRPRFNPNVTRTGILVDSFNSLPDSRQMSMFAACWLVGSIKYLAESGVSKVTFFETAGEKGVIQGMDDSYWPSIFPSKKKYDFPYILCFERIAKILPR